jgi:8-oxo-dGTP diphosphatase
MPPNGTPRFFWRCAAALSDAPPTRCAACGQEHYNNPRPAAEAVVIQDRRVLLIRRSRDPWRNCWDIPGGFLELDEHPSAAAERELSEETGLTGRATELLGIWPDYYGITELDGMLIATLNIAYRVELLATAEAQPTDDEALDIEWISLDELPDDLAFPGHAREVLHAAQRS